MQYACGCRVYTQWQLILVSRNKNLSPTTGTELDEVGPRNFRATSSVESGRPGTRTHRRVCLAAVQYRYHKQTSAALALADLCTLYM